jgi:hypothetical protein
VGDLFVDILREDQASDLFTVVLLGYRNGAAPTIRHTTAEHFLFKLRSFLAWPEETIERIKRDLESTGRALNERLGWLSVEQLRRLGFLGLD